MSWQVGENGTRDRTGIEMPEERPLPVIDDAALDDRVVSAPTLGQALRQERERRGIPLDRIEQATRIRSAQLRAIEDDRFEALPAEAYARGFVRTYAEYLGMDGDDAVARFNEQWSRSAALRVEAAPTHVPVAAVRDARPPLLSLWLVLACLVLAISAALYFMGGSGDGGSASSLRTTKPPSTSPETTQAVAAPPPSTARPAGVRMTVTASSGSCWLEARRGSATGALLVERTLAPGQAVRLHGKRIWLRLGDPTSARLRVNGRVLKTAYPAQPVNLMVTRRGAREV